MDSKVFGYARVSTKEQNLDRQLIALAEQGIEERNIIVDKAERLSVIKGRLVTAWRYTDY